MNKRVLALFLCCALVFGMVPVALSAAFSTGSDLTICDSSGAPADSITLPQNDKTTLTAVAETDAGHYQWQIRVSDSVWANIAGSTEPTLELSYAMVASLLKENSVDIRCRLTNDVTNVTYSNIAAVTVEAAQLRAAAKRAPAFGSVISGAEPIGEPIISEAPVFVQSTPASAPAAQNEEAPAAEPSAQPPEEALTTGNDESAPEQEPNDGGSSEDPSAPAPTTYSIVINYIYADGTQAAPSWTATVATGTTYQQEVKSPVVLGYTPDQETVTVNASEETTIYVIYRAAEVNYTVKHLQQKVENDTYELAETETKTGYTEKEVGGELAKKYEGFYSLLYDTTTAIAADGSTNVEVYYDRYYYLMSFNLDGGYGVEPIYARYGAKIEVGKPEKPGYTFAGWDAEIPATMPAKNSSYKANWKIGTSGFTVVFWYENADDNGYSVAGSYKPANVEPGTEKKSEDYKNQSFDGRDDTHFTYNAEKSETVTVSGDGSTVLNVYFTRNTYTLTFKDAQQTLTCTRTEHEHSDSCCKYGGTGYNHWYHRDTCCKLGLSEHTHNSRCYTTSDLTITAKYDSDITNVWKTDPIKSLLNQGYVFKSSATSKYYSFLEKMPGQNIIMTKTLWSGSTYEWYYYLEVPAGMSVPAGATTREADGKTYYLYHTTTIVGANISLTYDEDYYPITGYTQRDESVPDFSWDRGNSKYRAYLYYTRNQYELKFINYGITVKTATKYYQADISGEGLTPNYPDTLEANAYVFDGWYTDQFFSENGKFDFTGATMPAGPVILYAHWVPQTHTVKTYLTKDAMDNSEEPLYTKDKVPHGTAIAESERPGTPTNGEYKFVGWFYTGDDEKEKAFDFSMPVNRDLNLYAKWSSDVLVSYAIRYQLADGTVIADPTIGLAPAGMTRTFEAKTGTQLNKDYQTGYFPQTASHSLTIDIEGTAENKKNEFVFVYVAKPEVNYTVRYLEKDTNNVLHEEKHAATRDAVITETFKVVPSYAPDAYQKRLVLSADEENNIITFWYVKDDVHAPVQIIHWMQNTKGDGYTEYSSVTYLNGEIGQEQTSTDITIAGCRYTKGTAVAGETTYDFTAPATPNAVLGTEGLVLNLYYDRIEYPYEFRFLEQGTNKVLADPVKGSARYGAQVTQEVINIPGYEPASGTYNQQDIVIGIEDPATVAKNNVKIFEYVEKTADIKYQVVGPDGSGTLGNYQDNLVGVLTGKIANTEEYLKGSAPTAADGFKFVGWFKDKDCKEPVDTTWVDASNKLTPQKTTNYGTDAKPVMGYEAAIYYAKFELDVADLKITKSGWQDIDEHQSFLFDVTGPDGYSKRVVIEGNGSVTITGLKIGTYTVKEVTSWSWRYKPESDNSQSITLQPTGNTVTFENSRENGKWLGGDAYNNNVFNNSTN